MCRRPLENKDSSHSRWSEFHQAILQKHKIRQTVKKIELLGISKYDDEWVYSPLQSEICPHLPRHWPTDGLHSAEQDHHTGWPRWDCLHQVGPEWLTLICSDSLIAHQNQPYLVFHHSTGPPADRGSYKKDGIWKNRGWKEKEMFSSVYFTRNKRILCHSFSVGVKPLCHSLHTADMTEQFCPSESLGVPWIRHIEWTLRALPEERGPSPGIL